MLVAEILNGLLRKAMDYDFIETLQVGKDKVDLSHLQFTNDTIIFCPQKEESIKNYSRLLQCFEFMLGLTINFEISAIIPLNCNESWVRRVNNILGCGIGKLPMKYLGIPLGANPKRIETWKPIISRIEQKLARRKTKFLSKAGRLVLIKSVLNSLPLYYLGLFKMPSGVAKKIIAMQRGFLWGENDGSNGMALASWSQIQKPKEHGGLGVGDLFIKNILGVGDLVIKNSTLLFKWWWRLSKEECPFWKKMVCSCNKLNLQNYLVCKK